MTFSCLSGGSKETTKESEPGIFDPKIFQMELRVVTYRRGRNFGLEMLYAYMEDVFCTFCLYQMREVNVRIEQGQTKRVRDSHGITQLRGGCETNIHFLIIRLPVFRNERCGLKMTFVIQKVCPYGTPRHVTAINSGDRVSNFKYRMTTSASSVIKETVMLVGVNFRRSAP
jgi:hypothetical protein